MYANLKRLIVVTALTIMVAGPAGLGHAEGILPAEVQSTLVEAAARGDDALLDAVDAAVRANPELAQAIVDEASKLNPDLEQAVYTVALAAGGDVEIETAAGPLGIGLMPVLAGTGAAGAGGALAAGGGIGGGGGGGGGDGAVLPPAPPLNPGAPPPSGTPEFDAQEGLALVKAGDAYDRGLTGNGIVVAVLDTGLDLTHSEFVGQIAPGGFDFVGGSSAIADPNGHGTHVSGIVAARKNGVGMHGVAYDADILPVRIIDPDGFIRLTATELAAAIDHAVANGAVVINNSWGTPVDVTTVTASQVTNLYVPNAELNAYQRAVNDDTIIVFAAGNSKFANPNVEAGLPFHFSSLEDLWISVVSVDLTGKESSFTNRCGAAVAWCIAAPGTSVNSTIPGGGYGRLSGTSMATPHVSGAVAILLELFPGLTPEQVVDRLFATANHSGIYANGAIFGNGLLDLEAATRPVGGMVVLTGDTVGGPSFALTESTTKMGSAFGDGLQKSLGGTRLAVFDDYHATFFADLGPFVQSADSRLDFDRILGRFGKASNLETVAFGGGQLSYALSESGQVGLEIMAPGLEPETQLEELSLTSMLGGASEVTFAYNTHPALGFGLHRVGTVERSNLVSTDAFSAPYLSFAEYGYNFGTATEMPGVGTLVVGSFFGEAEGDDATSSFGTAAELAVAVNERVNVSFQLGMLVEEETFLGSETEGAFDLSDGVPTYFGGVTGEIALTDKFDLIGSIYSGVSYPSADTASLFTGFSPIRSQSFTLGVVGKGVFVAHDRFGLVANQPLRVTGGKADLSLATGRDRAGNVFTQTVSADLAANGREIDLEAFYSFALSDSFTLTTSAMLRTQPGHVENARSEGVLLFRLEHAF